MLQHFGMENINPIWQPNLIQKIRRKIEEAQKKIIFRNSYVIDTSWRYVMVKETQRFGDISVSFFRLHEAVKTHNGVSFRNSLHIRTA